MTNSPVLAKKAHMWRSCRCCGDTILAGDTWYDSEFGAQCAYCHAIGTLMPVQEWRWSVRSPDFIGNAKRYAERCDNTRVARGIKKLIQARSWYRQLVAR